MICNLYKCCIQFFSLWDTYSWVVCGYIRSKNIHPTNHMSKRDWTTLSKAFNHSRQNSQHGWQDLGIHSKNECTYTSNNHNQIKGGSIVDPNYVDAPSYICRCNTCFIAYIRSSKNGEHENYNRITPTNLKVWGCYSVTFLNRTPNSIPLVCGLVRIEQP